MKLFVFLRIVKQIVLSINAADDMRIIFLNKSKFGKWIFSFFRLKEIKYEIAFFNNFAIFWSILLASHLFFVIIKKPKDASKQST